MYFCHETLRLVYERAYLEDHRRRLAAMSLGPLRVLEDRWVIRRWAAEDRITARAASAIAVNSTYSQGQVAAAYERQSTVCRLGVNADVFTPGAAGRRRSEVLTIGSPSLVKGHHLLVEALARLPLGVRPALRLVMPVNDDSAWLEQLAASLRVRLIVESDLDEEQLVERYQRALATCCAARLEPFGLTPLESMASGTPAIAVRQGGFRESIEDGVTGWLVEPAAEAFATRLEALIADPGLADRVGAAGRAAVLKQWTWAQSGHRIEDLVAATAYSARGGVGQAPMPLSPVVGAFPMDGRGRAPEAAWTPHQER